VRERIGARPRGLREDAQQQAAREEMQAFVRALATAAEYDVDETRTESARTAIFRIEETALFVCAVRRLDGGCDWFRLDVEARDARIRLSDRDAGSSCRSNTSGTKS